MRTDWSAQARHRYWVFRRCLRAWLALSRTDKCQVIHAWIALLLVDLGLRVVGFETLLTWVEPRKSTRLATAADMTVAYSDARAIEIAAQHHRVRARCLHRALVLHAWLRRSGLPSRLRIGVRRQADGVLGHAWVELQGTVVYEPAEWIATFSPLVATGAAAATLI